MLLCCCPVQANGGAAASDAADGAVGKAEEVGGAADAAQPAAEAPSKTVVVLFGPHEAGSTTQAGLMGKRYGLPVSSLDDLLMVRSVALCLSWERAAGLFQHTLRLMKINGITTGFGSGGCYCVTSPEAAMALGQGIACSLEL